MSIHCPLSDLTRNLIDKAALCKMKKTALLINVARGAVVNNADLAWAINENMIAGAGLDVLCEEPMSRNNPLVQFKDSNRLIITPHIAWATVEARTRLIEEVYLNLKAFTMGEKRSVVE